MPFIKGRFHINPIAGQALEAAREAEAALLALEQAARQDRQRESDGDAAINDASNDQTAAPHDGPIHRVEIEASELVPSHSGRAVRGFVARVHRQPAAPVQPGSSASSGASPETHVFADHRDLVSFLRDEFAKDCK